MNWTRENNLSSAGESSREIWNRYQDASKKESFELDVTFGKKTDILALKKDIVEDIRNKVKSYQTSRRSLFSHSDMVDVKACPVCGTSIDKSENQTEIYGAKFVKCDGCHHIYLKNRPSEESISEFYKNDTDYASTYTHSKSAEMRVESIAMPWLEWTLKKYKEIYGTYPRRILDVGAGAGHFLEACKRKGIEAVGSELSDSSREFSKQVWGIEIDGRDFLEVAEEYKDTDLVTFWGLLEHTPQPGIFLQRAKSIMSDRGMVLSKVPRWNCLSAASQIHGEETIIRHLDPAGHIMIFTDESTAELHYLNGFEPKAAWYYGMDVYEQFFQVSMMTGEFRALTEQKTFQMDLQQMVDEAYFSDQLVLVCTPR